MTIVVTNNEHTNSLTTSAPLSSSPSYFSRDCSTSSSSSRLQIMIMQDIKQSLYAVLGKRKLGVPNYDFQSENQSGRQRFSCQLTVPGIKHVGLGNSTSKKDAASIAARDFGQFLVREGMINADEMPQLQIPFALQKMDEYSRGNSSSATSSFAANQSDNKQFFGVKTKRQNGNHLSDLEYPLPERLQPLISGSENLGEPEVKAKWIAEFLPKPEAPRFFRPLCARLARQQQALREQQALHVQRTAPRIEKARARLQMSVSEVRAEQKQALKEARQRKKEAREKSIAANRQQHNSSRERESNSSRPSSSKSASTSKQLPPMKLLNNQQQQQPNSSPVKSAFQLSSSETPPSPLVELLKSDHRKHEQQQQQQQERHCPSSSSSNGAILRAKIAKIPTPVPPPPPPPLPPLMSNNKF